MHCGNYALNSAVGAAGDSDGRFFAVAAGDSFTLTLTPGTATSASWRIVSDDSGSPTSTLVGGGTLPGSLSYTASVANPATGVGFYIDSINGTATVTGSCRNLGALTPTGVPTLSEWGLLLSSAGLAMASLVLLRRRRQQR
ncbi:MAG: IPTL-CTERM sorting domain-containing protein [Burkholderiaceae bacterium]|nr:MAG: IPTL-CTERM sorting domain-containing protein [Burkholderiaceae bacterium]